MRLNPQKCKELVICFARSNVPTPTLTIDGVDLEKVQSHKVLGITLQNNLKWNDNVQKMISKGSKRLYILRTMKRAGVPVTHLLNLYSALIRSILKYCCPVWGTHYYQLTCLTNLSCFKSVSLELYFLTSPITRP